MAGWPAGPRSAGLRVAGTLLLAAAAGAAAQALHPIRALWRAGVSLSFHSDNQLMSWMDRSTDAARPTPAGFSWGELLPMALDAAWAS